MKLKSPPTCLSIAGSDPSGGAGVQADIKTFAVLQVYGCGVITSLTAQNSHRVKEVQAVSAPFIASQIELVLEDIPIDHIKIGMLGSKDAAQIVAKCLRHFSGQIVYDPVFKSTDGHNLFNDGDHSHLLEVVATSTVITPNIPELTAFTKEWCPQEASHFMKVQTLMERFPRLQAVIVTGGHAPQKDKEIVDCLYLRKDGTPKMICREHPRIKSRNVHGTGCAFAAAYTAYHLLTNKHETAFRKALSFMDKLLRVSAPYQGGMLHHLCQLTSVPTFN